MTKKSKFPPKQTDKSHIIQKRPKLEWSEYQKAIFKNFANGEGNTAIIARAGSSKSTVLIEGSRYIPQGKKVLFVAFNRIISDHLKTCVGSYVDCFTLHALGFKALRNAFGQDVVVNYNKMRDIVSTFIGEGKETWALNESICRCVSLCKSFVYDIPSKIKEIIFDFGIELFELTEEKFIDVVMKSLNISKSQKKQCDFDDMIYQVLVHNLKVGSYDFIAIDEFQDMNLAQYQMILKARAPGARVVICCDENQLLYKFRGANENGINDFIKKLDAKILKLPISYRCPTKIIELCKVMVPDIQAAPNAIEGNIYNIAIGDIMKHISVGSFILSRTNAPLAALAIKLLKNKIPAIIQGRDIGESLISFINKTNCKNINSFITKVNEWREIETKRLLSEKKDTLACVDKAECLLNLCEGMLTVDELKKNIEKLFNDSDDNKKVVLSTIHKAKGLEKRDVIILENTLRYYPGVGVEGEEKNIAYVAISRCMQNLYFCNKIATSPEDFEKKWGVKI